MIKAGGYICYLAGFCVSVFFFAGSVSGAYIFDSAGAFLSNKSVFPSCGAGAAPKEAAPWNRWTLVGDQLDDQYDNPDLATGDSGIVRCVFAGYEDTFFSRDILYAFTSDANRTWSDPNIVAVHTSTDRHLMYPDFAKVTDTDVWIVYSQYNESMNGLDVKFVRSTNGGAGFDAPVQISDDQPAQAYDAYPNAVADGDNVYVVWVEWNEDVSYVRFTCSTDGGVTWPAVDRSINDAAHARGSHDQAALAFDASLGRLYVAWATDDERVVVAWSDDGGDTWPGFRQVNDMDNVSAEEADIFVDTEGHIYVVWCDFRNGEDMDTFLVKSGDHGETWSSPAVRINDASIAGNQYEPHIFKDASGVLHAVYLWNVPMGMDVDVYYNQSTDNGNTWMEHDSRVNNSIGLVGPDVPCSIAVAGDSNGTAYVAWCDTQDWSQLVCTSNAQEETPTPTPTQTPTPSMTPTSTPSQEPSPTPPPTPTEYVTGVEIWMPADFYKPGDTCACKAVIYNGESETLTNYPLFVILDIAGALFFAPDFNSFSYYDRMFPVGATEVEVIPPFTWPSGAGAFSGAVWYGGLTNPEMTALFGELDVFEFGWSE